MCSLHVAINTAGIGTWLVESVTLINEYQSMSTYLRLSGADLRTGVEREEGGACGREGEETQEEGQERER